MSSQTAAQASSPFQTIQGRPNSDPLAGVSSVSETQPSSSGTTISGIHSIEAPDFRAYATPAAVRQATARLSAAQVSKKEQDQLNAEHGQLAVKVLMGLATEQEQRRFEYVRWSLDRIEDALIGPYLDALDAEISAHERLSRDIEQFVRSAINLRRG